MTSSSRSATSSGTAFARRAVDQDDELVASHPADGVGIAKCALQAVRDRHQQQVTHVVAEAVVHVLELVEIDVQGRSSGALPPAAGQELLHAVHDQGPVRQAGQRVVHRLMTQFVGLLTHDAQCPCAPGARHEHQRPAEQAQGDSCDQQCERVATCEHPAGTACTEGRDRPAIVQGDRRRLGADRRPATLERHA